MAEKVTPPIKGLAWKLAEVMGEVTRLAKTGKNTAQNYNFVKESDVSDAIRPLLAERHIWLWSDTVERTQRELFTAASGAIWWLASVNVAYQFIDGETGEVSPVQHYPGDGADSGDKALPKAQSMSLKYYLLKTFMLSTGADDAETDEKVDKAAAAVRAAPGPRVVRGNVTGVERGGKSEKVTEAQVREMSRLTKEAGLTAATLIPVVNKVLGRTLSGGLSAKDLHAFLLTLSSEDGGKLISVLASGFAADIETEQMPDPNDAEDPADPNNEVGNTEGFSLV